MPIFCPKYYYFSLCFHNWPLQNSMKLSWKEKSNHSWQAKFVGQILKGPEDITTVVFQSYSFKKL